MGAVIERGALVADGAHIEPARIVLKMRVSRPVRP
jgi:hypothetical protein